MKEKQKRLYYILAALLLLFTGCTQKEEQKNDASIKSEVTIRWMIFGEKSKSSDGVIAEFNKKLKTFFPDTTVEFEIVERENYQERWNMKMATNEPLDLVWIGNDIFNYTEEVKAGGFTALDYLLSTNGKELVNTIPANLWEMQKRDGKIYSVPLQGALYRKDYAIVTSKSNMETYGNSEKISEAFKKSQYSGMESYEALEEYLESLKQTQKLGTGISSDTFGAMAKKGYEGIYGPDSPFVIKIFDDSLTIYNKYEQDSYKEYFKTMSEWYKKGYIREDVEEVLDFTKDNGTKNGNALFMDEYGENGVVLDQISTEYEAVRIPIQDYKYTSYESCRNAVAIPRTTENPKRAMEIINLLNTEQGKELTRLLCNGFEGRHFVKTGKQQIDRVTDKKGEAIYSLSPYAVGNVFLNYENTKGEFNQLKIYNESSIQSPLTGFELDTRMIVLEMAKIDLVVEEYIKGLECGTAKNWEETYNEMIAKMKAGGSEKVIAEMQKQIQKFQEEQK